MYLRAANIVRMISTKQRTIAMSALAIVAVLALFASAPLVTTHQAQTFWGGGCGCGGCGCGLVNSLPFLFFVYIL
jgi:hypothetical protein